MDVYLKWVIYVEEWVKLFLNSELSRLTKTRKCIFGSCGWKTTTPRMHFLPGMTVMLMTSVVIGWPVHVDMSHTCVSVREGC